MKTYGKISHLDWFGKWEKNNMGIFYGKLYNSHNTTFSVGNGGKFIVRRNRPLTYFFSFANPAAGCYVT